MTNPLAKKAVHLLFVISGVAVVVFLVLINRSLNRSMDELEKTRTEVSRLLKERTQLLAELKTAAPLIDVGASFRLAAKCEGLGGVPVGGVHEIVVCVRTTSIIEVGNP
jgi:hypothetical protein